MPLGYSTGGNTIRTQLMPLGYSTSGNTIRTQLMQLGYITSGNTIRNQLMPLGYSTSGNTRNLASFHTCSELTKHVNSKTIGVDQILALQ